MGEDQWQHAVLVHLAQFIAAHLAQFIFVDHAEAAIDERLFAILRLDRDFAVHQQPRLLEFGHEGGGPLAGGLELLAKIEDALDLFAWLVAIENRVALAVADDTRGRIDTQRQLVAAFVELGEQERIAAQIGRQIDRLIQHALVVEEGVDALVQPHQRQRHRIVAN